MPFPRSSAFSVAWAIQNGHVGVLEWWYKESPLPFQYSAVAVTSATAEGHVHVLEWLAASGVEFRFTQSARTVAIVEKKEALVKWWDQHAMYNYLQSSRRQNVEPWRRVTSDFVTLCSFGQLDLIDATKVPVNDADAMSMALQEIAFWGHLEILVHFEDQFRPFAQVPNAAYICDAVNKNHVHVLQWCSTHFGFQLVDKAHWVKCARQACQYGHVEMIYWIVSIYFIDIKPVPTELVEAAMSGGETEVLDYLFLKGLDLSQMTTTHDSAAVPLLVAAANNGLFKCLQWWVDKNLPFPESTEIAAAASQHGHWLILEWLHSMQPTVPFMWCESAIWAAIGGKHKMTCKWWLRSGLVKGSILTTMLEEAVMV